MKANAKVLEEMGKAVEALQKAEREWNAAENGIEPDKAFRWAIDANSDAWFNISECARTITAALAEDHKNGETKRHYRVPFNFESPALSPGQVFKADLTLTIKSSEGGN